MIDCSDEIHCYRFMLMDTGHIQTLWGAWCYMHIGLFSGVGQDIWTKVEYIIADVLYLLWDN